MSAEVRELREKSLGELVDALLLISPDSDPYMPDFDSDPQLDQARKMVDRVFMDSAKGIVGPDEACEALDETWGVMTQSYPEHSNFFAAIASHDRAQIWRTHAKRIAIVEGKNENYKEVMQTVSRNLLIWAIGVNTRHFYATKPIYESLFEAGEPGLGNRIIDSLNGRVVFVKDEEEVQELARLLGETDPERIKRGIVGTPDALSRLQNAKNN